MCPVPSCPGALLRHAERGHLQPLSQTTPHYGSLQRRRLGKASLQARGTSDGHQCDETQTRGRRIRQASEERKVIYSSQTCPAFHCSSSFKVLLSLQVPCVHWQTFTKASLRQLQRGCQSAYYGQQQARLPFRYRSHHVRLASAPRSTELASTEPWFGGQSGASTITHALFGKSRRCQSQ
jgi:hypothetical protein